MKEKLHEQELKVLNLLFNALTVVVRELEGEKIDSRRDLEVLDKAVQLCHKIRSLLPVA